jgi:RNA polymerase sigma-70 factor (ECF subfamily)
MADSTADGDTPAPGVQPPADGAASDTHLSLLERARANDPQAWSRLVALYQPLVLFWCGRGGVHGADADDVAQEVFAAAAAGLVRFHRDRPGDTFRGWLCGITRNQVLMHFRRIGRQPAAEGGSDAWLRLQGVADPHATLDDAEEAEVSRLYRRALEQIRGDFEDRTWLAFWLTTVEGRAPAALTDELGMSAASIRKAKSRVLRRLKREVGDVLG